MEDQQPISQNTNPNIGFPGNPAPVPSEPKKNWKWLIVLVLFLVVIAGVTFFVFKSSRSASTLEESPTPDTSSLTNVATPEVTSTPQASPADKTQVKIQVLNGTGVPGEAGLLATSLKNLGFTNVTTDNASTTDNTDTQVTFSSTLDQATITEITNTLKDTYTNVVTNNGSAGNFDVQITTGLRKGQTPAPASTTSPVPSATPAQ